ncbi:hypothetical protein TNCV_2368041 [Trichonephila clavipes]|nr:hypothetical protein TNCV_2368041 [Trichonephila clavipes]
MPTKGAFFWDIKCILDGLLLLKLILCRIRLVRCDVICDDPALNSAIMGEIHRRLGRQVERFGRNVSTSNDSQQWFLKELPQENYGSITHGSPLTEKSAIFTTWLENVVHLQQKVQFFYYSTR